MREETKRLLFFEALYIYQKYIFGKENNHIKGTGLQAIGRILKVSPYKSEDEIKTFVEINATRQSIFQAESLYEKLIGTDSGSFFEHLTEEELFLYYSENFEMSSYYGKNLAKAIDFAGSKILDIGGASGGLSYGIGTVYDNCEFSIFDTKLACETGEKLCSFYGADAKFYSGNFFEKINLQQDYDYLIFSNIFHDWNDKNCLLIMDRIKPLITLQTKLIIHEDLIIDEENPCEDTVLYGLRLCANVPEGRQRSIDEIMGILGQSLGFEPLIAKILNYGSHTALIVQFVHY